MPGSRRHRPGLRSRPCRGKAIKPSRYLYQGRLYTARELEQLTGINHKTLKWRIARHGTAAQALAQPERTPRRDLASRQFPYNSRQYTLTELSRLFEIDRATLLHRLIELELPVEEAILPVEAPRYTRRRPEYTVWADAKDRCYNPNNIRYAHYGGRGITMYPLWVESFDQFLHDTGPRPEGMTLERKDVNGNYEPDNCVWATYTEQANNMTISKRFPVHGELKTVAELGREYKLHPETIRYRLRKGVPIENAPCPARPRRSKKTRTP